LVAAPAAALAPCPDAELIALDMRIRDLVATARRIAEGRFDPFEDQFREIACNEGSGLSAEQRWQLACEYGRQSGREAAAHECNALWEEADGLFEKLCAVAANTPAARAAKVRAHLVMTFPNDWQNEPTEWNVEKSLILLAELAGVPRDELALSTEAEEA
jgi:hypothetical protein